MGTRDSLSAGGRALKVPDGFADDNNLMASYIRQHLSGVQSCELVWFRKKFSNLIAEYEVATQNGGAPTVMLYIGRTYKRGRGQANFDGLSRLWHAGFRPPSPFTVVRPIAYIADRGVLLQERAPGRLLAEILFGEPKGAGAALASTARWLGTLHTADLEAESRVEKVRAFVARYGRELMESLPGQVQRIERLTARALEGLEDSQLTPFAPSHGDFHSTNIFIADTGRVTAIDLVNFCRQEREADVAYFLAQAAIMGHFRRGSFAATAWARHCFLRAYLQVAPPLSRQRLALYVGIAFLQSLHYELCVYHTHNAAIVEPWLYNCGQCLMRGKVQFQDFVQPEVRE